MKDILYTITVIILTTLWSCQEVDYLHFQDENRIHFANDSAQYNLVNFYYQDKLTVDRDTFYLIVNTIGKPVAYDRSVVLKVDEKSNAIEGIHYIALNAPEVMQHMVVKANQVTASLPIILLRDKSLETQDVRLVLHLDTTKEFVTGETDRLEQTIILTDRLIEPENWSRVSYEFKQYSIRKHEFMIQVTNERIDEDWINRVSKDYSEIVMYRNLFVNKLREFNNDPQNIASGLAPMKDDKGNEITFNLMD